MIGDLTVAAIVELPLVYRGLSTFERWRRAAEAFERVSMSRRRDTFRLSYRAANSNNSRARVLGGDPKRLLAEEPAGNLDTKNGDSVLGFP